MNDTYVKTEHHSLGGCLKDSFKGILFGVILFLSAFPLLFWNEGRAVKTAQALDEGAGAVVSVASDNINRANEGKLVHMTGLATTDETLADQVFGVSFKGIKLSRSVSMYQWVEGQETRTEKKLGGGEERVTTYTYQKEWSMFLNNSSRFAQPDGHANPSSFPYESKTFYADKVSVGNFLLSPSQTGRIGGGRTLPVNKDFLQSAAPSIRDQLQINGGQFATGKANDPRIGDLRISFSGIEPTTVSLVSTQQGDTFVPYVAKSGYQVDMLRTGSITAEAMFEKAMADNTFFTWGSAGRWLDDDVDRHVSNRQTSGGCGRYHPVCRKYRWYGYQLFCVYYRRPVGPDDDCGGLDFLSSTAWDCAYHSRGWHFRLGVSQGDKARWHRYNAV